MATESTDVAEAEMAPPSRERGLTRRRAMAKADKRKYRWRAIIIRRFWNSPVLRQDWGTEQESAKIDWFEVFYDLVYVAMAIKLATFLKGQLNTSGVLTTFLYFSIFWQTWVDLVVYWTRFRGSDAFNTVMMFVHSAAVILMGVNVENGLDDRQSFAVAAVIARLSLILLYSQVALMVERAKYLAYVYIAGDCVSTLFWIISAFTSKPVTVVLWCLAFCSLLVANQLAFRLEKSRLPINVEHMAERLGLFVMLILGETIISLITPPLVKDERHYEIVFFGSVVVFALKHLYFEVQPHEPNEHALRYSRKTGRIYFFAHWFLGAGLLGVGVAYKVMLLHASLAKSKQADVNLLCYSLFFSLFWLNIIRLAHPFKKRRMDAWITRIVIMLVIVTIPAYSSKMTGVAVAAIVAALSVLLGIMDMLFADLHDEEKEHAHHRRQLTKTALGKHSQYIPPGTVPAHVPLNEKQLEALRRVSMSQNPTPVDIHRAMSLSDPVTDEPSLPLPPTPDVSKVTDADANGGDRRSSGVSLRGFEKLDEDADADADAESQTEEVVSQGGLAVAIEPRFAVVRERFFSDRYSDMCEL